MARIIILRDEDFQRLVTDELKCLSFLLSKPWLVNSSLEQAALLLLEQTQLEGSVDENVSDTYALADAQREQKFAIYMHWR